MDSKHMGILLQQLRKEKNMTQQELSQRLHVSPQAVSKWECGNGVPDVSLLPCLAEILGVSMARLLCGDLAPAPVPEQGGEFRIPQMCRGKLYLCCSRDGLFAVKL